MRKKKKAGEVICIASALTGVAFLSLYTIAKKKRINSQYENEPEEKNPFEGKKVVFIADENDPENADGERGHLKAVENVELKQGLYDQYIKRGLDLILSFYGLVFLSPLFLATVLAIKIDDPGPVLFTQKRIGQNKKYFKLHKFRSMKMSTPHDVPTHMLEDPDQYITRVGRFLRSHSLDELPQIWDIFIGNMSVIGPRPGLWNQDVLIAERDKYGANEVKPGLTGWAQINGRDEIELDKKAALDGEYARKESFLFDAKCFFRTLKKIGKDDSIVEGGTGVLSMKKSLINNDCKVSIITPAYNASSYLRESVESVQHQTYQNWELIIIDDCSSDDTHAIAQELAERDERIIVLKNKNNSGVAATRNRGLDEATGKYIAFLDSDDLWLPEKLEKQVAFMESGGYVLTYTNYQKFNSKNGEYGKIIRAPAKMTAQRIYGDTSIGCLTVMVNRYLSGSFHMPLLQHTEDNVTWQRILEKGFTAYRLDEVLSLYREGNESLTNSKKKAAHQQWEIYRDYYGFSFPVSAFYFSSYAFHAIKKHFI